jgi:hypothetical protein
MDQSLGKENAKIGIPMGSSSCGLVHPFQKGSQNPGIMRLPPGLLQMPELLRKQ